MAEESRKPSRPTAPPPRGTPLHSATGKTIKWDEVGKRVEGIFIALEEGSLGGKMVVLQLSTGRESASAPAPLARALLGVKAGTKICIEYQGEQELEGERGEDGKPRRTKLFKVWAL